MEVQETTVTELEAHSVTELQEILNAAKECMMDMRESGGAG